MTTESLRRPSSKISSRTHTNYFEAILLSHFPEFTEYANSRPLDWTATVILCNGTITFSHGPTGQGFTPSAHDMRRFSGLTFVRVSCDTQKKQGDCWSMYGRSLICTIVTSELQMDQLSHPTGSGLVCWSRWRHSPTTRQLRQGTKLC